MRGRKPRPTALKVVQGEKDKRRLNPNEPKFDPTLPDPPDWLDDAARGEWDRKAGQLHGAGVLTAVDDTALALYCAEWSRVRKLTRIVAKEGEAVTAANGGTIRNPNAVALVQAKTGLNRAMLELGITPSARTRVKAVPKPKANKWADVDR